MVPHTYSITFYVLYLLPTVVQSCTDLEYPSNPGCIPTDPNQTPSPNCDKGNVEVEVEVEQKQENSSTNLYGPWTFESSKKKEVYCIPSKVQQNGTILKQNYCVIVLVINFVDRVNMSKRFKK